MSIFNFLFVIVCAAVMSVLLMYHDQYIAAAIVVHGVLSVAANALSHDM